MDPARARLLRQLPQVDELLRHPDLLPAVTSMPHALAAAAVRRTLAAKRAWLAACPAAELPPDLPMEGLLPELLKDLESAGQTSLRRVLNATGVVIHTNLGRSPLAAAALAQIQQVAAHYSTLEYDLSRGERGSRHDHLEGILKELTGAEAALVVNNNAAAVLLALRALAQGKEVIVSRGQLVEIGGSFRMPAIMAESGALLREVGTTNKTHLRDYEQAITLETAMLLKVHPSNFRITGFTSEVALPELAALGRKYGLLVVEDLGSGCLIDLSRYGLEREPTVQEALKAGADLVTVSGDKLLGGPQAGLALGTREVVARLRQHPLTRALRPDKLTLAALEATLRLYLDEPKALAAIPTLRMLSRPLAELTRQAQTLARYLKRAFGPRVQTRIVDSIARVGGGALPQSELPSRALALAAPPLTPAQLEARLRAASPPIIARIEQDMLLLDMRTLLPDDLPVLKAALLEALAEVQP
jgi:L-seryl-tRNA(Ser) seleniumtransferase